MGKLTDKVKGNLNEIAGKVKQQSPDPVTRDKGHSQELRGKGQQLKGAIKGTLGDHI